MGRKTRLSPDAKILWELYQEQPLTSKELQKKLKRKRSWTDELLNFLVDTRILRRTQKEVEAEGMRKIAYAFYDYIGLEDVFEKLPRHALGYSINRIASLVGKSPDDEDFKKQLFKLLKKYDLELTADGKIVASSRVRNLKEVFGQ